MNGSEMLRWVREYFAPRKRADRFISFQPARIAIIRRIAGNDIGGVRSVSRLCHFHFGNCRDQHVASDASAQSGTTRFLHVHQWWGCDDALFG